MVRLACSLLALACGLAAPRAAGADDAAEASTRHKAIDALLASDAKALRTVVGPAIQTQGLWFDDAACATRFSTAKIATVAEADVPALVACVVGLGLSRAPDAGSFSYLPFEPGGRITVFVQPGTNALPDLVLAAGSTARELAAHGPQVTPESLEPRRTAGKAAIEPDAATRAATAKDPKAVVHATMAWCVDRTGKVSGVEATETTKASASYVQHLTATIRAWTFKPAEAHHKPVAVCAYRLFQYPTDRKLTFDPTP
jgi:hypothetical protein